MSTGKLALGLLAGLAAGAALGILFAPNKGSKTRKKIAKKGEDLTTSLKQEFDEMANRLTDKYEQVIEDTDKLITNTKVKFDETVNDV
ncbi:MAG: YtxH domain-containing protein [Bacteroidia bacterium]|jgi:gas vesicle protein